jgi:hypothetical protein
MSIIAAGTTTTTALSSTGNTDGTIQLQVNGTTPSVTLNALGAVGVGASPNFGTSGQALVSAGSTAAPTWTTIAASQWTTSGSNISYTAGQVQISTGSAAAPALSVASDTNTGIFFPAADTIAFAEGGAEVARFDSSGNLGVGTTTPVGALQVLRASANPTVNVTRTTSSATTIGDALYLRLNDTNGTNGMRTEIGMGYGIPGTQTYTPALIGYVQTTGTANTLGDIYFATRSVTTDTAPTERARITNTGAWSFGSSGTATGTSGQVLTSAGSGAAPTWADAAAGGSLIFLSEVTASNSNTVDIETTFNSTYDEYVIKVTNLLPAESNTGLRARIRVDGAYDTGSNYGSASTTTDSAGDTFNGSNAGSAMFLTANQAGANRPTSFEFRVHNPASTSVAKGFDWAGILYRNGALLGSSFIGAGLNSSTSACTGVRLYMSSGAITSGTFRLYGIKKN